MFLCLLRYNRYSQVTIVTRLDKTLLKLKLCCRALWKRRHMHGRIRIMWEKKGELLFEPKNGIFIVAVKILLCMGLIFKFEIENFKVWSQEIDFIHIFSKEKQFFADLSLGSFLVQNKVKMCWKQWTVPSLHYRVRQKFCDSFNKYGQKSKIICYKHKFYPFIFYVINTIGIIELLNNKNINIKNIIRT